MKYLLIILLLICSCSQANFYSYADGDLYLVADKKAYKVEVIDGIRYTTNFWFPLDQYGYTDEHVKMAKERNAKKLNKQGKGD